MGFLRDLRNWHPRVCLEAYYGLKRGEPWALRHLNAADNYYETNGADINRLQAWHNQKDRFRPVFKNYAAIFGGSPQKFRYNVISAISSSAYCQVGPGYGDLASDENRDFLKQWRAWASEHHRYLKVKRDLFDCPGDSAVDGSAHMIGDRGFDRSGPQADVAKIHGAVCPRVSGTEPLIVRLPHGCDLTHAAHVARPQRAILWPAIRMAEKWERCWEQVRYCSDRCRARGGPR